VLLAVWLVSDSEPKRISRALATGEIEDMRSTRTFVIPEDADAVIASDEHAVMASTARDTARTHTSDSVFSKASAAATITNLLGISQEGVRLERKRRRLLGLECVKHNS
jgi:hypothetical protein